jgi:hypothetical protein
LRIYTDENVDVRVAEGLRRRGVDAFSARDLGTLGHPDARQFARALEERAVIFTHDHHFLAIAAAHVAQGHRHYGVIFAEIDRLPLGECVRRLGLYAEILSAEDLVDRIEFL